MKKSDMVNSMEEKTFSMSVGVRGTILGYEAAASYSVLHGESCFQGNLNINNADMTAIVALIDSKLSDELHTLLPDFLPDWFYLLMAGIGMGLISIIAPVDCIEKPMDMEDKKKMHIRVRYLICLLFVLYFVLYIFGKKQLCVELVLVVECALATLIIELIRKYFRKHTGE